MAGNDRPFPAPGSGGNRQLVVRTDRKDVKDAVTLASENALMSALQMHGPAPGAKKLLQAEKAAAEHSQSTGLYVLYRSSKGNDCTRIGPNSMCFCAHRYAQHRIDLARNSFKCGEGVCACKRFEYIITRPEEAGEHWLPRRKDFVVADYRAKCKCKHTHEQHSAAPAHNCMACNCYAFQSAWLCVVCERHHEEHETVFETEDERKAAGRPVGADYMPFAETPEIGELVFRAKPKQPMIKQRPKAAAAGAARPSGALVKSTATQQRARSQTAGAGSRLLIDSPADEKSLGFAARSSAVSSSAPASADHGSNSDAAAASNAVAAPAAAPANSAAPGLSRAAASAAKPTGSRPAAGTAQAGGARPASRSVAASTTSASATSSAHAAPSSAAASAAPRANGTAARAAGSRIRSTTAAGGAGSTAAAARAPRAAGSSSSSSSSRTKGGGANDAGASSRSQR